MRFLNAVAKRRAEFNFIKLKFKSDIYHTLIGFQTMKRHRRSELGFNERTLRLQLHFDEADCVHVLR